MGQPNCSCFSASPKAFLSNHREASVIKTPLAELQSFTQPQYFVLPWSHQYFRNNFEQRIREKYPNITIFRNRQELAAYDGDGRINILLVTCEKPQELQELKLLQLPNFHIFSQIAIAQSLSLPEEAIRKQDCQRKFGFRFARILKETSEEMTSFMAEAKEGRAVYFCHRDYGHINRINLLFDYFFRRGEGSPSSSNSAHFFQWAQSNHEEGQEFIDRLQTLTSQLAIGEQLVRSIWNQNKICIQVVEMLRKIRNPCVIAHIAWFCYILFKFIRTSYSNFLSQFREGGQNTFVAWVGLTKEDIETMEHGQNFMFSTFVTGSSNLELAQPAGRPGLTYYKFHINLEEGLERYDRLVDLGLFSYQDKVIFNLQNMYRLVSFNHTNKVAEVTYCSVGPEYTKKMNNPRYSIKPPAAPSNIRMMSTYDVYFLYKRNVRYQLDLILALQFYHLHNRLVLAQLQAIGGNNTNIEMPAGGSILVQTASSIDERLHPSNSLFDKIGDSELSTLNFAAAEESYSRIPKRQSRLAKLLYLHYTRNARVSFRQTMSEVERNRPQINQRLPEQGLNELELNKRVVTAGCLPYIEQLFKAVLLGRTDYSSALSISRTNLTNISHFFELKYVENLQPNQPMPPANASLHLEALNYYPLYHMASKVNLDLEIMNGQVGVQLMRKELQMIRERTDGLHFFLLSQDD